MKEEELLLTVAKVDIVKVEVVQGRLKLSWLDPTWQHWGELQNSREFQALINAADEKLEKSKSMQPKGKGKGPIGSGQLA